MARYHINPHTGNPGTCKAKVNCPYGDLTKDHFDSKEAAREAYEAGALDQTFSTLSKVLDEVTEAKVSYQDVFSLPDGSAVYTTAMTRADLKAGDRVYDEQYGGFYTVANERGKKVLIPNPRRGYTIPADGNSGKFVAQRIDRIASAEEVNQELIEAMHKAGWKTFDPALGPEQFDDAPEGFGSLTDETMDEMAAHYEAEMDAEEDIRKVDWYDGEDDENGNPTYEVRVSNYGEFVTDDMDVVRAAERVAASGQFGKFESWDEDGSVKMQTVERYLNAPEPLANIAKKKEENEGKLRDLGSADDLGTASKRFNINLDNAMLDIANNTILSEEAKKNKAKLFESEGEPPF